jgi:SNF2 family DNA or RNA helicase
VRVYGRAWLESGDWHVECEPQAAIRLKRLLARVDQEGSTIRFRATDETARELEWFAQRYPLDFGDQAQVVTAHARRYDRALEFAAAVLGEGYKAPEIAMQLPARNYQATAAALAESAKGLLLADDVGLGKTVTGLALLALTRALPALIICPPHIQLQWQRETWRFLRIAAHICKHRDPYSVGRPPDVWICSYSKLSGWRDLFASTVRTVVFDEVHELRTGEGSDKYSAARHVAEHATYRLGCSATPIYNYGHEFWNVLDVLAPGALGERHEFLREWCAGQDSKARVREPAAFGVYLRERGLMMRRTRADVHRELPPLTTIVETVDSDPQAFENVRTTAAELARIILERSPDVTTFERFSAAGQFDLALRQATGLAKSRHVASFVRMLLSSNPEPLLLFGWHRAVYDVWLDELADFRPQLYTGTESPRQKDRAVARIRARESQILIMSLRSGSGVDGLQDVCSRGVVGELDWSPGAMEQCLGRFHRDGQMRGCFGYYLVSNAGSDPTMVDVLGIKSGQIDPVRDPDAPLVAVRTQDPDHVRKLAEAYLRQLKG